MRAIFCDETGDPGWRVDEGASSLFVVCALRFADDVSIARALERMEQFRADMRWYGELKWTKLRPASRVDFMLRMLPVLPDYRVVIWRKDGHPMVTGLSSEAELLKRCVGGLISDPRQVRLVVDGERNQVRASALRAALGVAQVRFEESHRSPCLQLADILAGFHTYCAKHGLDDMPNRLHSLKSNVSEWR